MKVVHLTRGFGDYLLGLVNAMTKVAETHLIVSKGDEWLQQYLSDKVNVFKSNAPRVSSLGNIRSLLAMVCYIRKVRPDVIHLQSGLIWELLLMKLFPKIPFVVTIHDIKKHPTRGKMRYFPQSMIDFAGRNADALIVHGDRLKIEAERHFKGKVIYSIPHGVISRYGTNSGKMESSPEGRVLFFGSLDEWKGIEYLVAAEPSLRKKLPAVKIIIAGGCAYPAYYRSLVKPGQNIELRLERQGEHQVKELFEWADVIAIPYIEASQSGVLQLAYSFALPAVATNVGGLPDVVINEQTGILIEPREPKHLSDAIYTLISDPFLRKKVILNLVSGRDAKFSWASIANDTMCIYKRLVKRRGTLLC